MNFKCQDNCGACCLLCDLIDELKDFDAGDGRCKNLNPDMTCAIYDQRPDICNIDKGYTQKYSHMSREMYDWLTCQACENLRKRKLDKLKKK